MFFKKLWKSCGGVVVLIIVIGLIASVVFDDQPTTPAQKQIIKNDNPYRTIILKPGCTYAFDIENIKKLSVLNDNKDYEGIEAMMENREVIEVISPRLEIKIIDRTQAPIFKVEFGGSEVWTMGGCVDVVI